MADLGPLRLAVSAAHQQAVLRVCLGLGDELLLAEQSDPPASQFRVAVVILAGGEPRTGLCELVVKQLRAGHSIRNTAKITGKSVSTVQRVKAVMPASFSR